MDVFNLLSVLVTLAAVFAWVNHRYLRLPSTIGVMVISILFSLFLVALGRTGLHTGTMLTGVLEHIDFSDTLLHGMLGALLFAGALHLNLDDLRDRGWLIGLLATVGVLVSTAVVGSGSWLLFRSLEMDVPGVYCFLFGALISPTDPIAVGGILRKAGVPDSLLIKITGESLFNDGLGVVLFILILEMATGGSGMGVSGGELGIHTLERSVWDVLALVGKEVGGGLLFGGLIGWIVYLMLARVDRYQVEILLTLAIVTGGYAAAQAIHMSGPLAMVVAGLLIGNHGRSLAMSTEVVERLDQFWELVDEFLNAVLFVLIGLEILLVDFTPTLIWAGLGAIPLVILARFLSAGLPVTVLRRWRSLSPHAVKLLTWSGLKGGISVAMALSLPQGRLRDTLVSVTYVIVVFSIVVQGLTVGSFAQRLSRGSEDAGSG